MNSANPNPAGEVVIGIDLARPPAQRFAVQSRRPTQAARVFQGRTLAATVSALPRLYNVCGGAQTVAALGACECAAGIEAHPDTLSARHLLLRVEAIREHLWRLLIDWPNALGLPTEPVPVATAMRADATLRAALADALRLGGCPVSTPPPVIDELRRLSETYLFGTDVEAWLSAPSGARFDATRERLRALGWEHQGRTPLHALPRHALTRWNARLAAGDADEFVARPTLDGAHYETGSVARTQPDDVSSVSVFARWLARMRELALLLQGALTMPAEAAAPAPGLGIAVSEAARGTLVHRVTQHQDRVTRYQILAPTEWNFHPQGPLACALAGLDAVDPDTLAARIRVLVTAIDPCVGWRIEWVTHDA